MISSLKRALQPAVTDISIKFDVPPSFKVYQAPEKVPTLFSGDKVVVYGIMKKRKSVSDQSLRASVNGTATLTGQILSKPVEFKITFEIPPPSTLIKMPIIHHLASKSLIHDLQSGHDWTDAATTRRQKDKIVNLSIESGVVSSHTAYIALDEGQDKLIEGAVKTWDVVATMAQPKESMSSPSQSTLHFMPSILSSSSQVMLEIPCDCACADDCLEEETDSYFEHSFIVINGLGSPKNDLSELEFLISLQKTEGFWSHDVFQLLNFHVPLMRDNMKEVYATVYALAYMEIKFPSWHDEWELVARKAEAWLESQTLPDQVNLEELKKEASDYIIINLVE